MSDAHAYAPLAEAAYLEHEETAAVKHELVGGVAYAMAGGSERHNRIASNIFFHLRAATRGTPCPHTQRTAGSGLVSLHFPR